MTETMKETTAWLFLIGGIGGMWYLVNGLLSMLRGFWKMLRSAIRTRKKECRTLILSNKDILGMQCFGETAFAYRCLWKAIDRYHLPDNVELVSVYWKKKERLVKVYFLRRNK